MIGGNLGGDAVSENIEKQLTVKHIADLDNKTTTLLSIIDVLALNLGSLTTTTDKNSNLDKCKKLLFLASKQLKFYINNFTHFISPSELYDEYVNVVGTIDNYLEKYKIIDQEISNLFDLIDKDIIKSGLHEGLYLSHIHEILNNELLPSLNDFISWISIKQSFLHKSLLENKLAEAEDIVKGLGSAVRAVNGAKTEVIYSNSYLYHMVIAVIYDAIFIAIILSSIYLYICENYLNLHFPYDSNEMIKSLLPRLFLASNFILLITFCLRRSSHHRKISQQAQQTSLELQALPLFVKELRDDDKLDLYKDLAGKYFGQKIDQTQNDKIADIIQDQAKMSIDMAKTAAEMVKSLKEVKSESKPQNNTQQN